jgi:hypothetical protein
MTGIEASYDPQKGIKWTRDKIAIKEKFSPWAKISVKTRKLLRAEPKKPKVGENAEFFFAHILPVPC